MKRILAVLLVVLLCFTTGNLSVSAKSSKTQKSKKTAAVKHSKKTTKKTPKKTSKKSTKKPVKKSIKHAVAKKSIKHATAKKSSSKTKKTSAKKAVKSNSKKVSKYGQLLDWWKQARYIFPRGTIATVVDFKTGKSFKVRRTLGTNHADCEALTKRDTSIIKSIWGGFSWNVRPVIVIVNGTRIAASMSAMPHAGLDNAPAYAMVNSRSGGYSRGENLDVVKGNGMNGHFDIHFLNSRRHKDNKVDPRHQAAVHMAAGR